MVHQNYTVFTAKKRPKKETVKRVLPNWLERPEFVDPDLQNGPTLSEIEHLLDLCTVQKLKNDNISKLFPVQQRLLSWLLKCNDDYSAGKWVRDTCVSMPTGSGKTLSYVLPIIEVLKKNFVRVVRCLIVLPVQELALQIYQVVAKYCQGTGLIATLLSGASSFEEEQERLVQKNESRGFISRVDIIVATPGRLIDHIKKTEGFSLSCLRFLVIDEADRENEWLQYIPIPHSKRPQLTVDNIRQSWNIPAQKILLSATLSQDPEKLSRLGLFRPILFTSSTVNLRNVDKDINLDDSLNKFTTRYGNPKELIERVFEVPKEYKPIAIYSLLNNKNNEKTLVFTNSCETTHRLAILLQLLLKSKNISVAEISAHLSPTQREEILEKFVNGSVQVLISSDALARGLDIPGITLVISYDLSKFSSGYIHRAGRTGRGGNTGVAVSLILPNQINLFKNMLNKVGKVLPNVEKQDYQKLANSVNYQSHLQTFNEILSSEQGEKIKKMKNKKRKILKSS